MKIRRFSTFSGGIKMEYWPEIGQDPHVHCSVTLIVCFGQVFSHLDTRFSVETQPK